MPVIPRILFLASVLSIGITLNNGTTLPAGSWTLTKTTNHKVLTNARQSIAASAIKRFALLEKLVLNELTLGRTDSNRSLRPHYVILPKSLSLFHDLAPIRPEDLNTQAPGFYLQSDFNPIILAQATDSFGNWDTIHHEYAHRILHAHFDVLPRWADEGLAELFSSLRISKKNVRIIRSTDRTQRYAASTRAFLDWGSFFSVTSEQLTSWIKESSLEAQAYYAQASLFAELVHFERSELQNGYWELIARSRYKPITELDTKLFLGLDFSELDKAIRRQLKKPLSVSRSREDANPLTGIQSSPSPPSSTAALLAIAYTRSGKPDRAQSLLNQYQDLEDPLWLAAKTETVRSLDQSGDALAFATQALKTGAEDPFLISFATLRLYNTRVYDKIAALDSLKRAHARGDTSPLMYHLYFDLATKTKIPFEEFAPLAKEGIILHPNIEYASELNRLEANHILEKR